MKNFTFEIFPIKQCQVCPIWYEFYRSDQSHWSQEIMALNYFKFLELWNFLIIEKNCFTSLIQTWRILNSKYPSADCRNHRLTSIQAPYTTSLRYILCRVVGCWFFSPSRNHQLLTNHFALKKMNIIIKYFKNASNKI